MGADAKINFAPSRFIDPNEPNLLAGYTFADGELAQLGRYINRAATGAGFDLTTRGGTPLVGFSGGLYCVDNNANQWSGVCPGGADLTAIARFDVAPTATRAFYINGSVAGTYHQFSVRAAGTVALTMDGAVTSSATAYSVIGRGPLHLAGWHDGVLQRFMVNGVLADSDASVLGIPAGTTICGRHGELLLAKSHSISLGSDAAYRAAYVREFAKTVVHSITPSAVGEGPAGGILTGAVGEGDWFCPLGGATLQHVWRNDLSEPGGGRLTLTDAGALSLRRLAYMHPRAPSFGTWIIRYEVRDPATDSFQFALSPLRDVDYTAAGSGCYWGHMRQVGGPWWRTSLYYENGAQIDAVDTAVPVVGDRGVLVLTRRVDGTLQLYNYLRSIRSWNWSAAVGVDLNGLSSSYFVVAPRGAYFEGHQRLQSEATPHELEINVP